MDAWSLPLSILLFGIFELWMVCEHSKQGFEASLLSDTFAGSTFGNGVITNSATVAMCGFLSYDI